MFQAVPPSVMICILYNVGVIRKVTLTKTQGYVALAEAVGDGKYDRLQVTRSYTGAPMMLT